MTHVCVGVWAPKSHNMRSCISTSYVVAPSEYVCKHQVNRKRQNNIINKRKHGKKNKMHHLVFFVSFVGFETVLFGCSYNARGLWHRTQYSRCPKTEKQQAENKQK